MKFHLDFDIKKPGKLISHSHRLMLIGSCFTENIGENLRKHKFPVLENPNGILFNPVSVAEALDMYIENTVTAAGDLFELNETWHSWKHHSRFSGITAQDAAAGINQSTQRAHEWLKHADHLLITLGSAWLYTLTGSAANAKPGAVAANNHKAPADWFRKRLMDPGEVYELLAATVAKLWSFNPSLQVIFTISPVRHLREGAVENNRSKASLIHAVHRLVEEYYNAYYFPAYELVIDDLRDYRFYAEDLVHPNYQATRYVWEKFTGVCMNEDTRTLMKEIAEIQLAFQHKPFNPSTSQHRAFLENYLSKTSHLQEKHANLDLSAEIGYFRSSLGK